MNYVFQFGTVWPEADKLLLGTWLTLRLSALAMVLGLAVGVLGALGKASASRWVRASCTATSRRCATRRSSCSSCCSISACRRSGSGSRRTRPRSLAMVVNLGAYATEIVRAGIEAVPTGQIEAGRALGLRPHQIFRFVVLVPALRTVFPALGSQFILVMLASSVVSVISAEELTAVADTIIARNFRSFEFYFIVTGIYLALSLAFQAVFAAIDRLPVPPLERAHVIREFTFGEALFLVAAVRWTVLLAALAFVGGSIVGLVFAVLRVSKGQLPRAAAIVYIKLFQGTPLLMQLYLVYFGANLLACRPMPGWPRRWDSPSIPAPSWARSGAAASRPFRAASGTARGRWRSARCSSSAWSSCRRRCASPSRRPWASWCRC